jgi:hypothetical protein
MHHLDANASHGSGSPHVPAISEISSCGTELNRKSKSSHNRMCLAINNLIFDGLLESLFESLRKTLVYDSTQQHTRSKILKHLEWELHAAHRTSSKVAIEASCL